MRWAANVACIVEGRCVYRVLVGRSEGMRPVGRHRRSWVDNIKIDFGEIGLGVANRI